MAKHKAGLFSFEARGTIADSVTYQHEARRDYVRRKPIPTDPLTLPQQYQRWLYQDYVAWWHTLSAATKQSWESLARPYHMTGFAYWMRDRLLTWPDILAWWRLDEREGNIATDFSANTNNGTVFGATRVKGFIDYCLRFDGIDDRVQIPHHSSLVLGEDVDFTLESLFKIITFRATAWSRIAGKDQMDAATRYALAFGDTADRTLKGQITNVALSGGSLLTDTVHHGAFVRDGSTGRLYLDGDEVDNGAVTTAAVGGIGIFAIGMKVLTVDHLNGYTDNTILYNRALTPSDVKRHSERRYPS